MRSQPKRPRKPYLLFATRQTGSTPINALLDYYFRETGGQTGLGEYFSRYMSSFWDNGTGISKHWFPNAEKNRLAEFRPGSENWNGLEATVTEARFELLKKYYRDYFIRVFAMTLSPPHEEWLAEHYDWLFLERKDLFEQILSCLISQATGVWYRKAGETETIAPATIKAPYEGFKHFEMALFCYFQRKEKLKPKTVLYFEDFCARPHGEFLKQAGFTKEVDFGGLRLTPVQRPWPKRRAFSNLEEIEGWYRDSFLNGIRPLTKDRHSSDVPG